MCFCSSYFIHNLTINNFFFFYFWYLNYQNIFFLFFIKSKTCLCICICFVLVLFSKAACCTLLYNNILDKCEGFRKNRNDFSSQLMTIAMIDQIFIRRFCFFVNLTSRVTFFSFFYKNAIQTLSFFFFSQYFNLYDTEI